MAHRLASAGGGVITGAGVVPAPPSGPQPAAGATRGRTGRGRATVGLSGRPGGAARDGAQPPQSGRAAGAHGSGTAAAMSPMQLNMASVGGPSGSLSGPRSARDGRSTGRQTRGHPTNSGGSQTARGPSGSGSARGAPAPSFEASGMSLMSAAGAAVGAHGRRTGAREEGTTRSGISGSGTASTADNSRGNGGIKRGSSSFRSAGQPARGEPMVVRSTPSPSGSASPQLANLGGFIPTAPSRGGPTPGRGAHSAQPSPMTSAPAGSGRHLRGAAGPGPRAGHSRRAMGATDAPAPARGTRAGGIDAAAGFVTVGAPSGAQSGRRGGGGGGGAVPVAGFSPLQPTGSGSSVRHTRAAGGDASSTIAGAGASGHRAGGGSGVIARGRVAGRGGGYSQSGTGSKQGPLSFGVVSHGVSSGKTAPPANNSSDTRTSSQTDKTRPMSALAGVAGAADDEDVVEALDLRVRQVKRGGPKPRSAPNLILLAQNEGFPRDLTPATIKSPIKLTAGDLARGGSRGASASGIASSSVARASSFSVGGSSVQGLSGVFRRMVTSTTDDAGDDAAGGDDTGKEEDAESGRGGGMDGIMASAAMIVLHRLRKNRLATEAKEAESTSAVAGSGRESGSSGSSKAGSSGSTMTGLAMSEAAASAAAQAESALDDAQRSGDGSDVASAAARAEAFSAAAEEAAASKTASKRLGAAGKMSSESVEKGYLLWELVRRRRDHVARMTSVPEGHRLRDDKEQSSRGAGAAAGSEAHEDEEDEDEEEETPFRIG